MVKTFTGASEPAFFLQPIEEPKTLSIDVSTDDVLYIIDADVD
jgi:hypothetical protein